MRRVLQKVKRKQNQLLGQRDRNSCSPQFAGIRKMALYFPAIFSAMGPMTGSINFSCW
jgi:hypothetical protein